MKKKSHLLYVFLFSIYLFIYGISCLISIGTSTWIKNEGWKSNLQQLVARRMTDWKLAPFLLLSLSETIQPCVVCTWWTSLTLSFMTVNARWQWLMWLVGWLVFVIILILKCLVFPLRSIGPGNGAYQFDMDNYIITTPTFDVFSIECINFDFLFVLAHKLLQNSQSSVFRQTSINCSVIWWHALSFFILRGGFSSQITVIFYFYIVRTQIVAIFKG